MAFRASKVTCQAAAILYPSFSSPGEVIAIPGNLPHAVSSLDEPARAVDAWSPPRGRYEESDLEE
ncbi:MAG: hypothetical protein GY719_09800 [bacterium]|nr:hypothetical protein [bacterium]